jgi:GTP-binding protein HflX
MNAAGSVSLPPDLVESEMKELYVTSEGFEPERAVIVGVQLGQQTADEAEESLNELAALADTAGAVVVARHLQRRAAPDATYFIGSGKVDEITRDVEQHEADLVIFDEELSPAQARNIGKKCDVRVLDRSGIILDIFAKTAKTREARLQVEAAQLEYLLPRLTRQWIHLGRQAGQGGGGAGSPIGLRGPGETQLETDRRLIAVRIAHLKRELLHVERIRRTQRARRDNVYRCALVGYTNAGKSTLMNALTGSEVLVQDRLFATLDSTTRAFNLAPNKPVVLTDTVGFIRKLPHHLVASFRSTLAEASEADMVLHVVDTSRDNASEQIAAVDEVLTELDIHPANTLMVMNKVDACDDIDRASRLAGSRPHVAVSAVTGEGLDRLKEMLAANIEADMVVMEVRIPQSDGKRISAIHERGEVLGRRYELNDVILQARVRRSDAEALAQSQL